MKRMKTIPETVTIHVPLRLVKRGGRKEIVMPPGAQTRRQADDSLIKALGRAFRWKRMLESGEFGTIADLAQREGIAAPYLTRVFRLAFLAPDVIEAILEGRQLKGVTLQSLRGKLPDEWACQREWLHDRTQ
jgi:hypothetical protein